MSSTPVYKSKQVDKIVILIGNTKVGKTSLMNYLIGRKVDPKNLTPTIGVQYAPLNMRVGSHDIRVNIWDTSGAQQYMSITRSYYRSCHGIIIMLDITERKSFDDLKKWLGQIKSQIHDKDKFPKMIIANKIDLVESGQKKRAISQKQMVDFCVQNGLSFKQTSAKTGYNVRETFNQIAQNIYDWKDKSKGQQSWSSQKYYNSISLDKDRSSGQKNESALCGKCC